MSPEERGAAPMALLRRSIVNKAIITLLAAAALPLGSLRLYQRRSTLATVGTGAAIGAAGGAGVAAIAGGDLLTGAAIGAAVGGLAGAVWADRNGDGRADGYVYNGQYYEGEPAGYQNASVEPRRCGPSTLGGAATGAAGGAALGAGAGALIGGLGVLEGAAIGAAVGGIAGAVWANANNDGCVDGYVREGQYYCGRPDGSRPTGRLHRRTRLTARCERSMRATIKERMLRSHPACRWPRRCWRRCRRPRRPNRRHKAG